QDEALESRLQALVHLKGLQDAVWIRRVAPNAVDLGADFDDWRKKAGLEGATLKVSFGISERVLRGLRLSTSGVRAEDRSYLAALLEVLAGAPVRPKDFSRVLSVMAAVIEAA